MFDFSWKRPGHIPKEEFDNLVEAVKDLKSAAFSDTLCRVSKYKFTDTEISFSNLPFDGQESWLHFPKHAIPVTDIISTESFSYAGLLAKFFILAEHFVSDLSISSSWTGVFEGAYIYLRHKYDIKPTPNYGSFEDALTYYLSHGKPADYRQTLLEIWVKKGAKKVENAIDTNPTPVYSFDTKEVREG